MLDRLRDAESLVRNEKGQKMLDLYAIKRPAGLGMKNERFRTRNDDFGNAAFLDQCWNNEGSIGRKICALMGSEKSSAIIGSCTPKESNLN